MPQSSPIITNVTAGEISDLLGGRTDLSKFHNAGRLVENLIVTPWGPLIRRPGTRFVVEVKFSDKITRLLCFEFSIIQAYGIEAGDFYFRFLRDRGQIVAETTDAVITNGTFTGNITGWTSVSTGAGSIAHDATLDRLDLIPGGVLDTDIGAAEQSVAVNVANENNVHVLSFEVFGGAGDRIELQIGTTTAGSEILAAVEKEVGTHTQEFTPGATPFFVQFRNLGSNVNKTLQIDNVALAVSGAAIEIVTPYGENDVFSLKHTQSADILYLVAADFAVRKLSRTGNASWSLTQLAFQDGPYLGENITTTTLTVSALSGPGITITASATKGINNGKGFLATDVGRLVRIASPSAGWARFTAIVGGEQMIADVGGDFPNLTPTAVWRLGLYSDTTGHPKATAFHEQRLFFGGNAVRPARFDASAAGEFETFTPDVNDSDALAASVDANSVPNIFWFSSKTVLLAGAAGGEAKIGTDLSEVPLTPTNIRAKYATNFRCKDIAPVIAPKATLFLQRHGQKLHELVFDADINDFGAPDMTILSEHITRGGIVDMAYAQEPLSIVWACRADGELLGFTYQRDEEVTGWHRHPMAGTAAKAESVTAVPGTAQDDTFLIISRTINGATKRYIEFIEDRFEQDTPIEQAFFVDSGLSRTGAPTTAISGLDHLEGETVRILTDGATHPDKVVVGGAITLEEPGSVVHVGLGTKWRFKPQRPDATTPEGTAQTKLKRTNQAGLRLIDTSGLQFGKDENNLDDLPLRSSDDLMGSPPALISGDIVLTLNTDWDRDGGFLMQGDNALPATIVAIVPHFNVQDG